MNKAFIPFSRPSFGSQEIKALRNVINSGWVTTGLVTKKFEEEFAGYIGCKFAVAVSSCTAALHLSLAALGIGRGDKVITTPFTFAATANVIMLLGARPLFIDISPDTFNIEPEKVKKCLMKYRLNSRIKPKGIIPVHFAGLPCGMKDLADMAKKFDVFIVEDAAHALGSEYHGKKIGVFSETTCFSFYPTKLITTGEGGMVTTNNKKIAEKIRILSSHGITRSSWERYSRKDDWEYDIIYPGYKYNMTDLQAAMGLCQLAKVESFIQKRRAYSEMYDAAFRNIRELKIPPDNKDVIHSRHIYPIILNTEFLKIDRDEFMGKLNQKNIGCSIHFVPLHFHSIYKRLGFKQGDFPVSKHVYSRILSLPLFPSMTINDINTVICAVLDIVRRYRK